jgi:hypothetical protein
MNDPQIPYLPALLIGGAVVVSALAMILLARMRRR